MSGELERLTRALRECEMRNETVKAMVAKVKNDVAECERLEKGILENLRVLKQERIVVVASEYKEVLKNLYAIRKSLILLRSYQLERDKDAIACESILRKVQDDFRQAEYAQSNVVLQGNFGRKNG